jgi:tripartite-type tricarboxylate transporter receptor subunit TctC
MRSFAGPLAIALLGLVGISVPTASPLAQSYPNKPVRVIVPFPPAGPADVVARVVVPRLSELLGPPMVVENRPGASGTLGVNAAIKSEPDGSTILITTGDFITTPTLMPKFAYDPNRDLVPVTMIASVPSILVASIPSKLTSLAEVLAAAKAAPGEIAFSSPGTGTINHLGGEWLAIAGGVKLLHVPYRGGAAASTAVATGEVQLGAVTQPSVVPYVQAGKAKVIGLMSPTKPAFVRDLPSLADAGMPAVDIGVWVGLFVPAGTPPSIVARLDTELQKILAEPMTRERLNSFGAEAEALGPAAFASRIRTDADRYGRIIEQTGITAER